MVAVAQRGAIVSGIHAGRTNSQIAAFNSIPISTVKKVSKLYHDFLASGEKDEDFDTMLTGRRIGAGPICLTSGRRKYGLLAAQMSIPWTFLYGAWLRGTLIGPPITPRTPSSDPSRMYSPTSTGRMLFMPAAASGAAWRRLLQPTAILFDKYIIYM